MRAHTVAVIVAASRPRAARSKVTTATSSSARDRNGNHTPAATDAVACSIGLSRNPIQPDGSITAVNRPCPIASSSPGSCRPMTLAMLVVRRGMMSLPAPQPLS